MIGHKYFKFLVITGTLFICFGFYISKRDVTIFDIKSAQLSSARDSRVSVTSSARDFSKTPVFNKTAHSTPAMYLPPIVHQESSIYVQRQELARNMCMSYRNIEEWKQLVPTGSIWSYGYPEGIHYCILPKVGCTYWKKIFRFLNNAIPQNRNISKPSEIPRMFVHYGGVQNIPITRVKDRVSVQLLSGGTFMFSREPYSRLWSAYIDKLFLPDFWRSQALFAMKTARPNASQEEISCPKDVTFREFLMFITSSKNLNEHWEPMYRQCSPCHVNFDIIAKQETFSKDAKYILNRYGYGNLIEEIDSNTRVKDETSMLIEYNFNLKGTVRNGCFQNLDVAKRLWIAFKYNGYIHKDTEFPQAMNMTLFNSNPMIELTKQLDAVIENQKRKGITFKTQKRDFLSKAYSDIPIDILKKLKELYKYDFELFGYEFEPAHIFGERS